MPATEPTGEDASKSCASAQVVERHGSPCAAHVVALDDKQRVEVSALAGTPVNADELGVTAGETAFIVDLDVDAPISIGPLYDAGYVDGKRAATADAQAELARLNRANGQLRRERNEIGDAMRKRESELSRLREELAALIELVKCLEEFHNAPADYASASKQLAVAYGKVNAVRAAAASLGVEGKK